MISSQHEEPSATMRVGPLVRVIRMAELRFDQVNIVMRDVRGAGSFLRALGAEIPATTPEWAEWEPHHVSIPAGSEGFDADLDSSAFAAYWGGLPRDFTGVVMNLRATD